VLVKQVKYLQYGRVNSQRVRGMGKNKKTKWGSTTKIQASKIEYNIEFAINIE
jgi:hypothetical protein